MSLRHAILGFLSFQPFSGYDLKKAFDSSVQHFWPADQSQIYRTLKQLHKEDLITQEVIPREDRLDMKVYAITESGQEELLRWLTTPLTPADSRDPFLIQLYFAFMLPDEQAIHLLQAAIDVIDEELALYESVYQEAVSHQPAEDQQRTMFYTMITLEFGVQGNRWYRDWLESVKARIEAGEFEIASFEALFGPQEK